MEEREREIGGWDRTWTAVWQSMCIISFIRLPSTPLEHTLFSCLSIMLFINYHVYTRVHLFILIEAKVYIPMTMDNALQWVASQLVLTLVNVE